MKTNANSLLVVAIVAAWVVFGIIAILLRKMGGEAPLKSWIVSSLLTNFLILFNHHQIYHSKSGKQQNAQMMLKRRSGLSLVAAIIAIWALMGVINFVSWKLGDEHPIKDWVLNSTAFTILAIYVHLDSFCSHGEEQPNAQ